MIHTAFMSHTVLIISYFARMVQVMDFVISGHARYDSRPILPLSLKHLCGLDLLCLHLLHHLK